MVNIKIPGDILEDKKFVELYCAMGMDYIIILGYLINFMLDVQKYYPTGLLDSDWWAIIGPRSHFREDLIPRWRDALIKSSWVILEPKPHINGWWGMGGDNIKKMYAKEPEKLKKIHDFYCKPISRTIKTVNDVKNVSPFIKSCGECNHMSFKYTPLNQLLDIESNYSELDLCSIIKSCDEWASRKNIARLNWAGTIRNWCKNARNARKFGVKSTDDKYIKVKENGGW
jgi:hypothetical protein